MAIARVALLGASVAAAAAWPQIPAVEGAPVDRAVLRTIEIRPGTGEAAQPMATAMVVVLTYWLSYEYVRDPRHALEPENSAAALGRGAYHVLALLLPHLDEGSRVHLRGLAAAYVGG